MRDGTSTCLHVGFVDNHVRDLEVPVDEVVDLEVLVVIAKGVEEGLGNLDPSHVGDELYNREKWNKHIWSVGIKRGARGEADIQMGKG